MTDATSSRDSIRQGLLEFINTDIVSEDLRIGPDDSLEAAGVDSMSLMRILLFIEQSYGFWIPDDDLTDEVVATVDSLARYVAEHPHE